MKKKLFLPVLFSHLLVILLSILLYVIFENIYSDSVKAALTALPLGLITAAFFTFRFSKRISGRLEKMSLLADNISRGNLDQPLLVQSDDEVGTLEASLARIAPALKVIIEDLEEREGQKGAVLSSMGEAVLVTDRQGVITLTNKKTRELLKAGLAGKGIAEVFRDPTFLDLIEEGNEKWSTVSGEFTIFDPRQITFHATISPLIKNMKILGSVIVLHDISMLKKLETMRKDFVANVSHELKTPLTSIRGFAETLLDGGMDDKKHAGKFLGTILNNAQRLSRLVDDLLTLSNIELGKVTFDIREVNLSDVINSVMSTLTPKTTQKGLELKNELKQALYVRADRDRLEQILINLMDNAIKFTGEGSVTVRAQQQSERITISVTDTGVGIPENDLPRLGERFYRVDPARSRELGGTGLGLAIVKHLVTSMGGTLVFESVEGRGTTVRFSLPTA
ncbi:MAG: HAMP domain-containing protein [Proteobacteria bacterium]|nr:HAMP domain-containing protein [Pseudomonadota bacterium]